MRGFSRTKSAIALVALAVATASIMTSCGAKEETHEFDDTVETSAQVQELFNGESEVNKDLWYSNQDVTEKYNMTLEGLTPVEGQIYKRTGHQIYKDDTGTLYIISAFNKVPLALADDETLFSEKDGHRIYLTDTTDEKDKVIQTMQEVDKIEENGYTKVDNEKFNVIFNYKKYNIENLIKEDEQGTVFVNVRPLWEQANLPIIFEPAYEGFTLFRNELKDADTAVKSTMSRELDKTYVSADGKIYAENVYDPKTFAVWVQLDSLRSVFGFEAIYLDNEELLILKTDDVYDVVENKENVVALEEVKETPEEEIPTGSELQLIYTADLEAKAKAKADVEEAERQKQEEAEQDEQPQQEAEKPVVVPQTKPKPKTDDNGYDSQDENYGNVKSLTPTYPMPNDGKDYDWAPGQGWIPASYGEDGYEGEVPEYGTAGYADPNIELG